MLVGGSLTTIVVTCLWPHEERLRAYQNLQQQWLAKKNQIELLRQKESLARAEFKSLYDAWCLREDYESACQECEQLKRLLNSKKYQLIHTDWRVLKGVPFENFLVETFEALGYTVKTTKGSGDQGVDLIVSGRGLRLAVQAKGWAGGVGLKAVQEVFAGMTFYNCDSCVVITTSHFTSGARELARKVGCKLVEGEQISDLILGRIF
jgi:restriction endonuclease Mrr